jgi:hypothetical protein
VLEVLVGVLAGLLVLAGVAVIAGPLLPRALRGARGLVRRTRGNAAARRALVSADVHPTTQKALVATARLISLLKTHGQERAAAALRAAGRNLRQDEVTGLQAMNNVVRILRELDLDEESAQAHYRDLMTQLRRAINDRAEQLELLPF